MKYMKGLVASSVASSVALSAAFSGAVYAQSSVTLYGALDVGLSWISNESGHGNLKYDDGIYTPTTFGLQGSEDLGDGAKVIFKLENLFQTGTGSTLPGLGLFGRQSYVGLKDTRYGTLTLGNQFDFMFDSLTREHNNPETFSSGLYAMNAGPFTRLGIPDNPTGDFLWDRLGGQWTSNAVKYQSPQLAGFSFGAMYAFGGVPGEFGEGSTTSFGVSYDQGPFGIGGAYTEEKYAGADPGDPLVPIRNWGVGAHYNFGTLITNAMFTTVRNLANGAGIYETSAGVNWTIAYFWQLGADYVYMKGNQTLSNDHAHQIAATLSYLLSKRTRVYVQGVYQRTNSGANALINGVTDPGGASSSPTQAIARFGIQTFF